MPNNAGVARGFENLPVESSSNTSATTVIPAGEAAVITGIYVSAGAAGTFTFTNAGATIAFFNVVLQAAGQIFLALDHPFYVDPSQGGFRVNTVPATNPQFCVFYRKV